MRVREKQGGSQRDRRESLRKSKGVPKRKITGTSRKVDKFSTNSSSSLDFDLGVRNAFENAADAQFYLVINNILPIFD